ncbi:MAG: hypothetical protein H6R47_1071 [Proteobacteria bacterium]|nr:hypothetical protein [Pseudomonadota bacterium]
MHLNDVLAEIPAGLYVLTANGELGTYDAQRQLQIDEPLTQAFAEHNRAFLHSHLQDPLAGDHRIAILFDSRQPREWGHLMLSLEDAVVRSLYPASGRTLGGLTAFQQKSRNMSVYRGMELLLDYRHESAPEVPVYCPVLFNSHSTLAGRISALGREPHEQERDTPVLDVLNLIAAIPAARGASPAVLALIDKLRQGVIRKDQRRDSLLSVQHATSHAQTPVPGEEAYAQIARDKRQGRAVTITSVDERRLHETDHIEPVERWLKIPNQPVDTERLRTFVQFQGFDAAHLVKLTARSLIYTAPAGVRLLERGARDAWNLFLLEGALMLTPADGATLRIDGGTDKAAYPVAFLKPRKYAVETLTPVSFLWVHDLLLEAVLGEMTQPAG